MFNIVTFNYRKYKRAAVDAGHTLRHILSQLYPLLFYSLLLEECF
jgi:hypothetical protein